MGKTISWNTCFVKVKARTVGVVVNFMNAGFGGSIQPRKNKNIGWFPKGIIDSSTQNMALSCLYTVIQNLEFHPETLMGKSKTFFAVHNAFKCQEYVGFIFKNVQFLGHQLNW